MAERERYRIQGIVQGVGFRPFVAKLAKELALGGCVLNRVEAVWAEVEGAREKLDEFALRLERELPRAATIEHVERSVVSVRGEREFVIRESAEGTGAAVDLPPDLAICADCAREMDDLGDRRYGYAFLNCTQCGPRYTIVEALPYDRERTGMKGFGLCVECAREYDDAEDRRYHAQPTACAVCGPRLSRPVEEVVEELRAGRLVALKGIGGFHLVCDASREEAVERVRRRKARGSQPMAVMVRDREALEELVEVSEQAWRLLQSAAAPIVLLPKTGHRVGEWAAPGNGYLGVMLPYSPLHRLLLREFAWLIVTSANRHGEPIPSEVGGLPEGLADVVLTHDRPIVATADDSVVRLYRGRMLAVRRGRGYTPQSFPLPVSLPGCVATGAELKAAPAIGAGRRVICGPHIGDMENVETLEAFERGLGHLRRVFRIEPEVVFHDSHPGYLSTEWAKRQGLRSVAVQHHRAHVASVLAEYQVGPDVPVVGVVFDGTGWGDDGAIWGGEMFRGPLRRLERAWHLPYVALPGGDAAAKRPAYCAVAHLAALEMDWEGTRAGESLTREEQRVLRVQMEKGLRCFRTSSMGRLFDAAASLLGVRQRIEYEAQAAIEMEAMAGEGVAWEMEDWDLRGLWGELARCEDVREGAGRFHETLIRWTCNEVRRIAGGIDRVVLSGGVWQNVRLLEGVSARLEDWGLKVLAPRALPPNDGGIALGQVYLGSIELAADDAAAPGLANEDDGRAG